MSVDELDFDKQTGECAGCLEEVPIEELEDWDGPLYCQKCAVKVFNGDMDEEHLSWTGDY